MKKIINLICVLCAVSIFICLCIHTEAKDNTFQGEGTKENPYKISNADELLQFAENVNNGENYENTWFQQVNNIDLYGVDWVPIGIFDSGNYFYGVYDGAGHYISNLIINRTDNAGFFGQLGGICLNLGIESGCLRGACVGAISSHSVSDSAAIINCYNKADIVAYRAGGIADNFGGSIINCWSDCALDGEIMGGIISYGAVQVKTCVSSQKLSPLGNDIGDGCYQVACINSAEVVNELNLSVFEINYAHFNYRDINRWELNEKECLSFGEKTKFNLSLYVRTHVVQLIPYLLIIITLLCILKVSFINHY